jgi:hypothetical protein
MLRFASLLLLASLPLCGCSPGNSMDYDKVDLVRVSGNVMLDGTPLPKAVIVFEDPATGGISFARTDSAGNYTLQFDSEVDGVTVGPRVVRISTAMKILGLRGESDGEAGDGEADGESGDSEDGQPTAGIEQVPDCYHRNSALRLEVRPDSTTFNFRLKSDCSVTAPE